MIIGLAISVLIWISGHEEFSCVSDSRCQLAAV